MSARPLSVGHRPRRRPAARIALLVEEGGGDWHARRLREALEARGAAVVTTTLKACAFDTRCVSGLDIPGFDGELPDGAFVRSVSTGSLEQITKRLGILHALRESGVRVWNDARAIERCVDKSTATFLFHKAGLPTPPTRAVEGLEAAIVAARRLARPLVVATSIPVGKKTLATMAITPRAAWTCRVARRAHAPHGTGDLLSALFLAHRLKGAAIPVALEKAASGVDALIRAAARHKTNEMPLIAAQDALTRTTATLKAIEL